ncbi:hypothetical protein F511_35033 [Dorcoceras hygrometricum]|uniref:Uncharacterized protein n=1 Tax=Dorcoceras hygrometricum TaxID=472368 RepID=A0A2Z7D0V6_9LAMI|nr:hypothetical protein F511_35033 [Dorcoceras hygrometricum]
MQHSTHTQQLVYTADHAHNQIALAGQITLTTQITHAAQIALTKNIMLIDQLSQAVQLSHSRQLSFMQISLSAQHVRSESSAQGTQNIPKLHPAYDPAPKAYTNTEKSQSCSLLRSFPKNISQQKPI